MDSAASAPLKDLVSNPSSPKEKYECTRDSQCAGTEKCSPATNKCVPTCSLGSSCFGLTPQCLADDSHSYSCKQCLSNANCSADKKCSGYSCMDVCSGVSCGSRQCLSNGGHGYSCVDCLTNANCGAGNKCSGNSCISCAAEATDCRCPEGQVADGSGGCKATVPATCDVFNSSDPTSHYWNGNGSHTVPSGLRCWDGYGAYATISAPGDVVHEYVRIRFWQGATVNGPIKTKNLQFLYNTSASNNTITFNSPVTVNGVIQIQRSVTPVFKGGISGNYTCEYYDCVNNYGPCNNKTVEKCKF